jgi:hypothetical protein
MNPITRIALAPTRLMSDVGYSFHNHFGQQKIPISPIRKPIPKIIHFLPFNPIILELKSQNKILSQYLITSSYLHPSNPN